MESGGQVESEVFRSRMYTYRVEDELLSGHHNVREGKQTKCNAHELYEILNRFRLCLREGSVTNILHKVPSGEWQPGTLSKTDEEIAEIFGGPQKTTIDSAFTFRWMMVFE